MSVRFAELGERIRTAAKRPVALGVEKGDTVCMLSHSRYESGGVFQSSRCNIQR